ncbi:MAG: valine--tRNA ligase [Proteobacteria bacterium]|jgi:valyl-tRNA synthetase|nr:valine--tRNA ligase [Candidatus Fonsibacter sp. PEL4]
MLEDNYNHLEIEDKIYNFWESNKLFEPIKNNKKKYFSIVIPPPNVTGNLHMGHALNISIQDLLVRFYRIKGYETLWQPGTDHAGIATELVVEKKLNEKNQTKKILGRDKFLKEVWNWKEHSGNLIINQLKKLGSSCDWSQTRFTMDKFMSEAVIKVFLELHKQKLIYKDYKLSNWDPVLKTAISDLEVVQKEVEGKLYYIKYFFNKNDFITIATTRPETIFADTAIAVNPKDKRYKKLINKYVKIPIIDKQIKIITDDYADPTQGSGAVKITPAHDFNDYEVGLRHNLEKINILESDGRLNKNCPQKYCGLDRFEARKLIIENLKSINALEKEEKIKHNVPYGDRSNSIIEPYLTEQWFLNVKKMSTEALKAVKNKKTIFFPESWTKTYNLWLKDIRPWCISRQIWWGHQIPIWYGSDGNIFSAKDQNDAQKQADKFYKKKNSPINQDSNVLDTWFSSALWPFASLGWPKRTYNFKRFYKTSVLVTGFDILFFWVARMMMMGLFVTKKVPFDKVYIHALVRDEHGQKMSKSKGNVIDPLDLIKKYGADALRFTLMSMASPGRDVKLSEERVKGYRNFLTKIWNISKFCDFNKCNHNIKIDSKEVKLEFNQWIINEYIHASKNIENHIKSFRFDEASKEIYNFVWNIFCDWYLEFSKSIFYSDNQNQIKETKKVFGFIFSNILLTLHPFIPFITEELWNRLKFSELYKSPLINFYSNKEIKLIKNNNIELINWLIKLVSLIRSTKVILQVSPGSFVDVCTDHLPKNKKNFLDRNFLIFKKASRVENYFNKTEKNQNIMPIYLDGDAILIKFATEISLKDQIIKVKEKIDLIKNTISVTKNKLSNKSFINKAPKDVVDKEKDNLKRLVNDLNQLESIISIKN